MDTLIEIFFFLPGVIFVIALATFLVRIRAGTSRQQGHREKNTAQAAHEQWLANKTKAKDDGRNSAPH